MLKTEWCNFKKTQVVKIFKMDQCQSRGSFQRWVLDIKLEKWICKIKMACHGPAGQTETPWGPAPKMSGSECDGSKLQPSSLHEWQHQSQCQTEVERVQILKHDYCFELLTPPTRSTLMRIHDCQAKRYKARVWENPHVPTHTHIIEQLIHALMGWPFHSAVRQEKTQGEWPWS